MGTILVILVGVVIALVVASLALSMKYEQERLGRVMTAEEEKYFEIDSDVITPENLGVIMEYQYMKNAGEVQTDHPAIAARKIQG